jgi:hypothetical protein
MLTNHTLQDSLALLYRHVADLRRERPPGFLGCPQLDQREYRRPVCSWVHVSSVLTFSLNAFHRVSLVSDNRNLL